MTSVMSVVTIAAAMLRGKAIALCLGPAGVGLIGVLNQVMTMEFQILGLGLPTTVVKSVAGADEEQKPKVESVVGRLALSFAGISLVLVLAASPVISLATFQSLDYLGVIMVASVAAPIAIAAGIWAAKIQGRGEVAFLAKSQAAFAVVGALAAIPLVWYFGVWGLALSIVVNAAIPLAGFWAKRPMILESTHEDKAIRETILKAGISIVAAIAVGQVASYLTRLLVINQLGLNDGGLYQAALSVSTGLPGFIFTAMALDYYPRVSAASSSREVGLAINTQVQAGMVIATPLFVGMILFGGQLLGLYYTKEFTAATGLLAWMTVSMAFRIISWPAGYWLLAKAAPREYVLIEGASATICPILTSILLPTLGLTGVGMAMVISALFYALTMVVYMRRRGAITISMQTWGWSALGAAQILVACWLAAAMISPWGGAIALGFSVAVSLAAYPLLRRAKP